MSKLINIISLWCLFQTIIALRKFDPILEQLAKDWHTGCVMFTGATEKMIKELSEGNFDDTNILAKRYMVCIWMFAGAMDVRGNVDLVHVAKNLPSACSKEVNAYGHCNKEAMKKGCNDTLETIYQQQKCLFKRLGKDKYVFF